jgi:hypothetical protein
VLPHRNNMLPNQSLVRAFLTLTVINFKDPKSLIWKEENIIYGDWSAQNYRKSFVEISTTERMRNNGTIYAHIFFTKHGMSPNPQSPHYSNRIRLYKQHLLNKYAPRQKVIVKKNLLTGENETSTQIVNMFQESNNTEIISYWKGNLTISLVHDFTEYTPESIPPLLAPYFQFDQHGNYYPVIFVNEFWIMREHLSPINDTVKFLPLEMTYEPISLLKWSMLLQIETSFSMQRTLFGTEESEVEEFKRILLDNHPAILALTFVVSLLHSIFDFLAFKNDIQFWRKRKSLEGLSVRTLYINFICNAIIFLYLLDNETSWLVLVSAGVGLLIEAWKITRAVHIRIVWWKRIPYVKFQDKNSYASSTRQYDLTAMKYLSYAFYPLVVGYAIYSLIYEQHKSWYSWIISTLAGFVYTFGFIAMTPQLFINYKKKSVAHLPWRAFVYRALNTFIDDLFAFIIRMPTMHRLRCFRDDIVFLIYLYQRWIYPVDKNRIETFGEDDDVAVENSSTNTIDNTNTDKKND